MDENEENKTCGYCAYFNYKYCTYRKQEVSKTNSCAIWSDKISHRVCDISDGESIGWLNSIQQYRTSCCGADCLVYEGDDSVPNFCIKCGNRTLTNIRGEKRGKGRAKLILALDDPEDGYQWRCSECGSLCATLHKPMWCWNCGREFELDDSDSWRFE